MTIRPSRFIRALSLVFVLGACSDDDKDKNPTGGTPPANATRSSTCLTYQDAACDFLSDQCSALARVDCDDSFTSLFCKDDASMQACIDAFPGASCPDQPAQCTGVADPAPAIYYCNQFLDTTCSKSEACGLGPKAQCISEGSSALNCSQAVGALPSIDLCLTQLNSIPCDDLAEGAFPESCRSVIKVLTPTSASFEVPWARSFEHIRQTVRPELRLVLPVAHPASP